MIDPTIYPQATYPQNPMYNFATIPNLCYYPQMQPQVYSNMIPPQMMAPTPVNPNPQPSKKVENKPPKADHWQDELNKLTNAMHEQRIQVTNVPIKRQKSTNIRTNIWCANCKGHGHMATECASPPQQGPKCSYCGGNHDISKCWNLQSINQVEATSNPRPWVQKGPRNSNKRPFTKPRANPPYRPNDNRPRWNDNYNIPPVWNGPPTNPNTHYYGTPERGKHLVCYRCGELGQYASECPNPRKEKGYTSICRRCRKSGHITNDCREEFPNFAPSERNYPKAKQV